MKKFRVDYVIHRPGGSGFVASYFTMYEQTEQEANRKAMLNLVTELTHITHIPDLSRAYKIEITQITEEK